MKRNKLQQTIEVSIAPGGGITISTVGFIGSDCETATHQLEQALGSVQHRSRKPEFYQKAKNKQQQTLGS